MHEPFFFPKSVSVFLDSISVFGLNPHLAYFKNSEKIRGETKLNEDHFSLRHLLLINFRFFSILVAKQSTF